MANTKRYRLNFTLADGSTKSVECDIPVSNTVTVDSTSYDGIKTGEGLSSYKVGNDIALEVKSKQISCTG